MYEESYLRRAGQFWKLCVGMAALAGGGLLIWTGLSRVESRGGNGIFIVLVGTALGVVGMVWSAVAIKCPACGARLFSEAISKQSPANWLTWLLHLDACPCCGRREPP